MILQHSDFFLLLILLLFLFDIYLIFALSSVFFICETLQERFYDSVSGLLYFCLIKSPKSVFFSTFKCIIIRLLPAAAFHPFLGQSSLLLVVLNYHP